MREGGSSHDFNVDGGLLIATAAGVLLCSVITIAGISPVGFFGLLIALVPSSLPYLIVFTVGRRLPSGRLKIAAGGGLLLYLAIDLIVCYGAFFNSTSSTAGVAVMLVLLSSMLIIPAGAAITYLLLLLVGVGKE
ncbi:MAG: hypothetical protein LC785_00340 [Acidobacteria bacterium]|nr:hypothetical protein [Acidobacteriota bacterium]MCA1640441.1 hypothetical protein [Acidobacteriota bacterium]